jgi:hypothetical protein
VALQALPRRTSCGGDASQHLVAQYRRETTSDGQTGIALDATLALLKIKRVRREVPMDHTRTPGVEIQSFLANRCRGQHVRPKGRVEASADLIGSSWSGLCNPSFDFNGRLGLGITKRYGDMAAHWYLVGLTADPMKTEATGAQSER